MQVSENKVDDGVTLVLTSDELALINNALYSYQHWLLDMAVKYPGKYQEERRLAADIARQLGAGVVVEIAEGANAS